MLQPLTDKDCARVLKWVNDEPKKREWLIEDYIPANLVGLLQADGGVGKSNLSNLISYCISTGKNIGPFVTGIAKKVLQVNAEDPETDMALRINSLAQIYGPSTTDFALIEKNWRVYLGRGTIEPLMTLEKNRPKPTPHLEWLSLSIKNIKPELVILDTKSKLFGLDENSNPHTTAWIRELEKISEKYKCGVLILHHTRKMPSNTPDNEMLAVGNGRGASSLSADARYVISAAEISSRESNKYGLEPKSDYFKIQSSKNNYTSRKKAQFFHKKDEGVPCHFIPTSQKGIKISDMIIPWLKEMDLAGIKITQRDFLRAGTPESSSFKEMVSKIYGNSNRGILSDMKIALNLLVNSGDIVVEKNGRGNILNLA